LQETLCAGHSDCSILYPGSQWTSTSSTAPTSCFVINYAALKAQDGEGRELGAERGVAASMGRMIKQDGKLIGVATDHVIASFRNQLPGIQDEGGVEPDLLAQFPLLEDAITGDGVTVLPMVEYEAD
jgi:hypothetical protein